MLSKKELRAAARHARTLAMRRLVAGLNGEGTYELLEGDAAQEEIHGYFVAANGCGMTECPAGLDYAHASVFPLLALADELENAATAAPRDSK